MANFQEVLNEIKESAKGSKVTFSRTDFDRLAKAYVNDVDYKAATYSAATGEGEIETVKLLRGMLKRVLRDFGVDAQEAERVMDAEYQIKNVDGIYELCSELVYQYVAAGKKFSFITKPDFEGSILLEEVGASQTTSKGVGEDAPEFLVDKKAHKKLKVKSGCPKWLKTSTKK